MFGSLHVFVYIQYHGQITNLPVIDNYYVNVFHCDSQTKLLYI